MVGITVAPASKVARIVVLGKRGTCGKDRYGIQRRQSGRSNAVGYNDNQKQGSAGGVRRDRKEVIVIKSKHGDIEGRV